MIKGTQSEKVSEILKQISQEQREQVKEITLDLAPGMQKIVKQCFPKAIQVSDRFHVQKLAYEAIQELRIKHRWEVIEQENKEIELSKDVKLNYLEHTLENGDTLKQLLARSRYLLFKSEHNWTPNQRYRAGILFDTYPDIKQAYDLGMELGRIYNTSKSKGIAFTKLAQWFNKVELSGLKSFKILSKTIENNYLTILNYFNNKSTNAFAESFNAAIKSFRAQFRGIRSIPFFLFRLSKIYA